LDGGPGLCAKCSKKTRKLIVFLILQWVLFSLTGGALFLAAGSVIIDDWRHLWSGLKHVGYSKQYMDMMIASGIIGIFNAFVYLIDFGLTITFA
jgi:hypothetical protein